MENLFYNTWDITIDNKSQMQLIRGFNDTDTITIPAGETKTFIIKLWTCLNHTYFLR